MKFFRKLGFQLVLFFVVAITIPIVMLMVSSITTTSSSMENNMKVTSEQTLNEAQNQFTTYLKTLSQPVDLLTRKNEVKHLEDQGTLSDNVKAVRLLLHQLRLLMVQKERSLLLILILRLQVGENITQRLVRHLVRVVLRMV